LFLKGKKQPMKPAHLLVQALKQGMSPVEAIRSLPTYEPLYIHRVPVEVYSAAMQKGWRFFPVPTIKHLAVPHANLFHAATNNLQQLRHWARESPNWALVTGSESGVFVLEVDGEAGLASLLDLCGDDWSWLDTPRSMAGERRWISFAWPEGLSQISRGQQFAKGLRIIGEGDWVLIPPSREPNVAQHAYMDPLAEITAAPGYLLEGAFKPADAIDPSRPLPSCSSAVAAWSSAVLAEAIHDQV
jgi:hypothetical protein